MRSWIVRHSTDEELKQIRASIRIEPGVTKRDIGTYMVDIPTRLVEGSIRRNWRKHGHYCIDRTPVENGWVQLTYRMANPTYSSWPPSWWVRFLLTIKPTHRVMHHELRLRVSL